MTDTEKRYAEIHAWYQTPEGRAWAVLTAPTTHVGLFDLKQERKQTVK